MEDTIAAIATAPGEGGIGIVRISGENSLKIAAEIFVPVIKKEVLELPGYSMHYGKVRFNQEIIDEALLLVMRKPHSYTGEDVVEFQCHGGMVAVRNVLRAVLQSGARLAEPGEFTKRAFLNGRIDLSQAEAVIELIRAKTDKALAIAMARLDGSMKENIMNLRKKVLEIIAHIEAMIDFPEDDVEEVTFDKIKYSTEEILEEIRKLKKSCSQGKIYQDGVNVAIIGKPNVGKSSLLNALVGENKAIVTHIPGTTRDIVEEWLNIEGIPVRILDTAGLREAEDIVEQIGVERSKKVMQEADVILYVVDTESEVAAEDMEILMQLPRERLLVVINKIDIAKEKAEKITQKLDDYLTVKISAKTHIGIENLTEKLKNIILGGSVDFSEENPAGNIRHLNALERCEKYLMDVLAGVDANYGYDFIAIDLRAAWEVLGEITGETVNDDILDHIFANFCIGK